MMNLRKKIDKLDISLSRFNALMLIIAVLTSVILFFAMYRTSALYKKAYFITQEALTLTQRTGDLQNASDYLTEQIRCFSITGDRAYLDNYFEEAKVTKRREHAIDALEEYDENSVALADLKEAMKESVSLMEVEYYAARMTVEAYGYDVTEFPEEIQNTELSDYDKNLSQEEMKDQAQQILFNETYRYKKEAISSNMKLSLSKLSSSLKEEQNEVSKELEQQMIVEHVLTWVLIILMFTIVFLTYKLIIRPLKESVSFIRNEKDIPLYGAYEIRFLAKTYNLMYHTHIANKEQLNFEATHDELTGLYNRRGYEFLLDNVDLETSALLLFDLDEFKSVNDTYGHDVGDKVLLRASDAIAKSFRNEDYVCRLGGDEFVVIMVHATSDMQELIKGKIQRLNDGLKDDKEGVPAISVSVGVAFGKIGLKPEELLKNADKALYDVKNSGRKNVGFNIV
ncbi:MAG TPA: hypothetical protein DHV77_09260 [Erysipelotrichaceae bacterium]|nr:hypothetical protein [Erysipelotrichaceae bacterium]